LNVLQGNLTIDTSVWIEFFLGTVVGEKLKNYFAQPTQKRVYLPLHAISEMYYILCRLRGENFADVCINNILVTKSITIDGSLNLARESGKIKCSRSISLVDCSCIALAKATGTTAVFKHLEKEIEEEIASKPFDVPLIFLEEEKVIPAGKLLP